MTRSKRLKERLEAICSRYGIEILYVFGSRSDEIKELLEGGIQRLGASGSDTDLGAKLGPGVSLTVREKARMSAELEDLLGVDRVDLCFVNETDPFVAAEIIRGERVYCADELRADEYELYILRRAGDLVPFEQERMRLSLGEPAKSP